MKILDKVLKGLLKKSHKHQSSVQRILGLLCRVMIQILQNTLTKS